MKYIFLILPFLVFAQTPVTTYYDSGEVLSRYFVKNKTLDSTFVSYYKNGNIRAKTQSKNCEYETNYHKMYRFYTCSVGKYFDEEKKILNGKRHGKWSLYYENGNLESVSNYHCGIEQGNFIRYRPNGTIKDSEFYYEGNLIMEREYHESGTLKLFTQYTYVYDENIDDGRYVVSYVQTEFRVDSTLKSSKEVSDYDEDNEKGIYKEYYLNGFLKFSEELVEDFREGIYREFYENGNKKYEGRYIDEERVEKHYYYNIKGAMTKIETWDTDKLIRTEYRN